MDIVTPRWKLIAARGLVALVFGFVAFGWPSITLSALAMLFGAYTLLDGVFAIAVGAQRASVAFGSRGRARPWTYVLEGLLGVAFGLIALLWTSAAISRVAYGIGAWAIATGLLELVAARALRALGPAGTMLRVGGVLSLILGVVVLAAPYASAVAFVVVLAAYTLTFGAAMLGHAMDLRRHERRGPGDRGEALGSHA